MLTCAETLSKEVITPSLGGFCPVNFISSLHMLCGTEDLQPSLLALGPLSEQTRIIYSQWTNGPKQEL